MLYKKLCCNELIKTFKPGLVVGGYSQVVHLVPVVDEEGNGPRRIPGSCVSTLRRNSGRPGLQGGQDRADGDPGSNVRALRHNVKADKV